MIRNGDEIRAYYASWTRCESVPFNAAMGLATSRDGGNVPEARRGPLLSYSDEAFPAGSPRIRRFEGAWQLWYVAGKEWRMINGSLSPSTRFVWRRRTTASTGSNWADLITDKLGRTRVPGLSRCQLSEWPLPHVFSYRDIQNKRIARGLSYWIYVVSRHGQLGTG